MNISTAAFGGKHTPRQVLLDALNHADSFKCCVLVYIDKDDYVYAAWSDGSMLKRMGMMDVAKTRMLEAGQEDE